MKLFQIKEDDLVELEHILPQVMEDLMCSERYNLRNKKEFRRIQQILTDVRWNYGPWGDVEKIENNF